MQAHNVADMTVEELKGLIRQVVDEQLQNQQPRPKDTRTVQEILKSIEQHRWTPPTDSPSTTESIRQDRDRDTYLRFSL